MKYYEIVLLYLMILVCILSTYELMKKISYRFLILYLKITHIYLIIIITITLTFNPLY